MNEEKEIEKLQKEENEIWEGFKTLSFKQRGLISKLIEINIRLEELSNR